jgi:uncharacterized protein (TIGR00369 family)
MHRTKWFERQFPPIADNGLLPGILERLAGTPARLRAMVAAVESTTMMPAGWSPAKEIGHLVDLEPLWLRRVHEILEGRAELTATDLSNRATHEADHDRWSLPQLVDRFEPARRALVVALRGAGDTDLDRSARHPRLGTPMRLVDLAYFVAEHDDHHLARLRELLQGTRSALNMVDHAAGSDLEDLERIRQSFAKQGLMTTLGARLEHVSPGAVEISLPVHPSTSQQHGFIHAGAVSAIADSAAGYAALTLMPSGRGVLTTEFKINLLAPATGDRLVARARVIKAGRTLTLAQTEVFAEANGQEKLVAFLTATLMTVDGRDGVSD